MVPEVFTESMAKLLQVSWTCPACGRADVHREARRVVVKVVEGLEALHAVAHGARARTA